MYRQTGLEGQYDIQANAAIYIRRMFDAFKKQIATQSCPTEERASTLFGAGYDEKQFIRTAVCNDTYWKKTNLSDVYPWMAFQLLSTKDWNKAGDRSDNYDDTWKQFISELESTYSTKNFSRPPNTYGLEQMRFTGMDSFTNGCNVSKPGPIFDGIGALRALYDKHNTRVWNILNDIIVRIKHPEKNTDIIRLHPNVISGGKSSSRYVEDKAAILRTALKEHYLEVEKTYVSIVKSLKP